MTSEATPKASAWYSLEGDQVAPARIRGESRDERNAEGDGEYFCRRAGAEWGDDRDRSVGRPERNRRLDLIRTRSCEGGGCAGKGDVGHLAEIESVEGHDGADRSGVWGEG